MIIKKIINEENRLFIEIKEMIEFRKAEENLKIKLSFKNEKADRLFPVETTLIKKEENKVEVAGKASIFLPYVFLEEVEEKVRVEVELFSERRREEIGEAFYLEKEYFKKPESHKKKETNTFSWLLALSLLPFALFNSFIKKNKGRALLVKSNYLVKNWTGVSFSIREFKTDYLKKQYQKAFKKKIKPDTVLFLSERKVEKGGNLSLVFEALKKKNKLTIKSFFVTKTVDKLSFKELRELSGLIAEAKLIILEDFYPQLHALELNEKTKVIQLWHACGAFKTFGFSRLHKPGGPEEESRNHRNYDRVFVSGEKMIPYYSEAFAIPEKKVLPLGIPRTDIFFDEEYKKKVQMEFFQKFPLLQNKKIILFAPTFRGLGNKDAFYPSEAFSVEEFMKEMEEDVILIIKQHPFVKNSILISSDYKDRVFDFSALPITINDLFFITNLLVTDYSSSIFEAALLDLPMLFYVFDEEAYKKERDFYGDFDSFIPGNKAKTMKELIALVKNVLEGQGESYYDLTSFKETYLSALDGSSTERIVDYILYFIGEEKGE